MYSCRGMKKKEKKSRSSSLSKKSIATTFPGLYQPFGPTIPRRITYLQEQTPPPSPFSLVRSLSPGPLPSTFFCFTLS